MMRITPARSATACAVAVLAWPLVARVPLVGTVGAWSTSDVDAAVGAIIAWLVDTLVFIVSDGEYDTLAQALFDFERGDFCPNVAGVADDLADQLGAGNVYDAVLGACDLALGRLIDEALDAINEAMVEFTALRLQGRADIADANTLANGHWAGTLAGRDFTGDFRASRR